MTVKKIPSNLSITKDFKDTFFNKPGYYFEYSDSIQSVKKRYNQKLLLKLTKSISEPLTMRKFYFSVVCEIPDYRVFTDTQFSKAASAAQNLQLISVEFEDITQSRRLAELKEQADKREKFHDLASKWRSETALLSIISEKVLHPAYQQIIGMGPDVMPLLLEELEQQPDHWFWALKAITGANPVRSEHRGRLKLMAQDWLQWGKDHGYEW